MMSRDVPNYMHDDFNKRHEVSPCSSRPNFNISRVSERHELFRPIAAPQVRISSCINPELKNESKLNLYFIVRSR